MLFGFIADRKIIAPINLNTLSVAIATVPLFVYGALTTFMTQAGFSVTFAIGIGESDVFCLALPQGSRT